MPKVLQTYTKIFNWFNENRSRELFEKNWLDKAIKHLDPKANILDLGYGMGEPITKYLFNNNFKITGVDNCDRLIKLAKNNLPNVNFLIKDMRYISFNHKFDFIIAWNSFFHLSQNNQRKMFNTFKKHLNNNGILMFTSGPEAEEIWSDNGGEKLYHASLSPDEYKNLLAINDFSIIDYKINDENCNGHTIWLAKYKANN
jgi:2-polyprenyl-3-methyl-5-hydroxy-6-metoxy-1,4-benzoquinol methylase